MDGLGYPKAALNAYLPVVGVLPLRYIALRRVRRALTDDSPPDGRVFDLPWKELITDLAVWIVAGLLMAAIYHGFYTPYSATWIKIIIGCSALGIFTGILSYLKTERLVIHVLANASFQGAAPSGFLTLSRKIVLLVVVMLCMMATAIFLMIFLDVWYLIENTHVPTPKLYWGVFKEIAFALVVLLGISLMIIKQYSTNLKKTLEIQLTAMSEISRGQLDTQVPVVSSDEFAQFARQTNAMILGLKEREICKTSFEKYVSPEISHKILEEGISPDGEVLDVTILFCDLRGYTAFVEKRNPREVVAFINFYFAKMESIIRSHGGVVLQYIGDEVEAVFGAPTKIDDHADRAVAAALEMRSALERINVDRKKEEKGNGL